MIIKTKKKLIKANRELCEIISTLKAEVVRNQMHYREELKRNIFQKDEIEALQRRLAQAESVTHVYLYIGDKNER